jgi:N-acetylmuramoyl-L-alanine amidase
VRTAALAAALALLTSACAGDVPRSGATGTRSSRPAETSPSSAVPSTSSPPTSATSFVTVAAADARLVLSPRGVVVPVIRPRSGEAGWVVRTPCGREVTLSGGTPLGPATIVLDPGHGGVERGAVGPTGLAESSVNLAVAEHARRALEQAGVSVVLTRTGDHSLDLPTRAAIARAAGARALVSIHHNADPDGPFPRPGSETYYQRSSPQSRRLAGLIYEEVVPSLSVHPVAWVGDRDAGAKYRPGSRGDYYAILRLPAPIVSVLAELAFISNPAEATLLARPDVQEAEGRAVARGVLRWLSGPDPGSGFVEPYPRVDPPGSSAPPACAEPSL